MSKDKIRMPASEGGIVRYFDDEYKSKFTLPPLYVVGLCIAIAVVAVILRFL